MSSVNIDDSLQFTGGGGHKSVGLYRQGRRRVGGGGGGAEKRGRAEEKVRKRGGKKEKKIKEGERELDSL